MIKCFLKNKQEIDNFDNLNDNLKETSKNIENIPIEGRYNKIDLSEDEDILEDEDISEDEIILEDEDENKNEDRNKNENKDKDKNNNNNSNNQSYSNLDKIMEIEDKSDKMEDKDKLDLDNNKMEEFNNNKNDINFNPFKISLNLKYCKPCAICYFFPSNIFSEKFILLEKVNEEIKNKNKMLKFICKNAFKNETKIYTNYYLNEITYLIRKEMYLFQFQNFKFFAEYFDMIYYFNEYNGKNNKQNDN